jgi:hypothetical protein
MVTIYPDKGTIDMAEEIAGANVNRSYTLAATNIAIFSFMMFFLYPRFEKGSINPYLFQCTLAAMAVSTFSLVLASILYYRSSVGRGMTDPERMRNTRQADGFWLVGLFGDVPRTVPGPLPGSPSCGCALLARAVAGLRALRDWYFPAGSHPAFLTGVKDLFDDFSMPE